MLEAFYDLLLFVRVLTEPQGEQHLCHVTLGMCLTFCSDLQGSPSSLTALKMHCNYHCMLGCTAATIGLGKRGCFEQVCFCYIIVDYTDPNQVVLVLVMENTIHMMVPRMKVLKNNSSEKLSEH